MIYFSFRCFILSLLPPLFSLPKSEDFACGRCCFVLITQMYSIYFERDTERLRDVDSRTKCNREEEWGEKFERGNVLMFLPGSVVE